MNKLILAFLFIAFYNLNAKRCCTNYCKPWTSCLFTVDCCEQCNPYTCDMNCPKAAEPVCEYHPECGKYFCNCNY